MNFIYYVIKNSIFLFGEIVILKVWFVNISFNFFSVIKIVNFYVMWFKYLRIVLDFFFIV